MPRKRATAGKKRVASSKSPKKRETKKKAVRKKSSKKKTVSKKKKAKSTSKKKTVKKTKKKKVGRPRNKRSVNVKNDEGDDKFFALGMKDKELKNIFDVDIPDDPLNGAPKEVQEELDGLALHLQKDPEDEETFLRIVAYIHKYLLSLVFKKFSFIKGHDENDIYQEALIALSKKAIPKFDPTRGMSFLNYAKMCINSHLVTILNASINRKKDFPINNAISLSHNPLDPDDEDHDGNCVLSNVISDDAHKRTPYDETSEKESYNFTLSLIKAKLSTMETIVLEEYLKDKTYKEMAKSISKRTGIRFSEKTIDNALLRIRKKASGISGNLRKSGSIFGEDKSDGE